MIQHVRHTGRRLKVRASQRLRLHFLSLARRVAGWRQSSGLSGGVVIGVTSVEPRAGTSVVAFNLAASLASICDGNVLFVETRFGKPGVSRKAPRPGFGLSEVIKGAEELEDCICQTNLDRLYVLGCGRESAADALRLPLESIASINHELCSTFDYVIYDLPLADEVSHCYPIARQLDGVLLVNTSINIDQERILRAMRHLQELSTPVIGLVLNKA